MRRATTNVLHSVTQRHWPLSVRAANYSTPQLTKDVYKVKRGNFSSLTDKDINVFEGIVGKTRILTEASDVEAYNVDWLRSVRGSSQCVLKPKTSEEVSAILKHCNERRLAVCPQGGNTGLAGGSNPIFDEVVISTSLMNKIISFDSLSGVLTCQAGCVLEQLESYLLEQGFLMPLDLGAKGSCQIGGNVSTNAGGLRLVRYGSLHGTVLGIKAVLANGEIIDCMNRMKKDNTGYHLKHLFIGSEGTLGLVTEVAIHCPVSPKSTNVAFLGLDSYENVLKVLNSSKRDLGEILSSCELMDRGSLQAVEENLKLRIPIEDCPFYMLIETSGSNSSHDEEKLSQFLENALEKNIIMDGTQASEPSRIKQIFEIRERIAEALLLDGFLYTYDISLKPQDFYSIVPVTNEHLKNVPGVMRVNGFGHFGMEFNTSSTGASLWELRESITQAVAKDGYTYKYDISLPQENFYNVIEVMRDHLSHLPVRRVVGYGHIGDGNIHLNITSKEYSKEILNSIEPFVYEWTSKFGGSVSAEHGIGFKKTGAVHFCKPPQAIQLMHQIKNVMDPNGILNPYKVLPEMN